MAPVVAHVRAPARRRAGRDGGALPRGSLSLPDRYPDPTHAKARRVGRSPLPRSHPSTSHERYRSLHYRTTGQELTLQVSSVRSASNSLHDCSTAPEQQVATRSSVCPSHRIQRLGTLHDSPDLPTHSSSLANRHRLARPSSATMHGGICSRVTDSVGLLTMLGSRVVWDCRAPRCDGGRELRCGASCCYRCARSGPDRRLATSGFAFEEISS